MSLSAVIKSGLGILLDNPKKFFLGFCWFFCLNQDLQD